MSNLNSIARRPGSGGRLPPLNIRSEKGPTAVEGNGSSTGAMTSTSKLVYTLTETEAGSQAKIHVPAKSHTLAQENWSNQYNNMHGLEEAAPRGLNSLVLNSEANKPKFVYNLENYLVRELDSLGLDEDSADSKWSHDSKLQAHREVFQYLIEDFRSYRPILSTIKNEYEMMLKHQTDYIKQLEPLQQMLITVTQQCDIEIMKIRDNQNAEVEKVREENNELQAVIDGIRNERFALETQVQRLNQRLEEQYGRYRSEADARKLLVSDINDLKNQQEELLQQQREASNKDKSEDPVVIRQSLQKAREDERATTDQIINITANYGDVIPKQDYLDLKDTYSELQTKTEAKTTEMEKLKTEHDELLDIHKQVIKQRDELYQERERLKQTATPRPDWSRCSKVVPGGVDGWQTLATDKSSDQLVGVLLNELAGTGSSAKSVDFFDGLGLGDEVPAHMRYEGQVKNRRISRRDAALLIRDIWREKDNPESKEDSKATSLSHFILDYLKSKFPEDENMAYEWSYNLVDACKKYKNDDRISMFYAVLSEKIDERLYSIQLQYIVALLGLLTRVKQSQPQNEAAADTSQPADEATISHDELKHVLAQYFNGLVQDEQLEKLVFAAQQELNDPETVAAGEADTESEEKGIEFMRLFFEDDEGKFGPFIDELKKQLEILRTDYVKKIISMLPPMETPEDETVSPTDLETAIYNNDTQLDASVIENLLLGAYEVGDRAELEGCPGKSQQAVRDYLMSRYIKPVVPIN